MSELLGGLIGKVVVVDTDGPVVYLGRLVAIGPDVLTMEDVDVHNLGDSATGREKYVIEAKKFGVRANRRRAEVLRARVVGVSLLDDVMEY